jgi:hypothetical protein
MMTNMTTIMTMSIMIYVSHDHVAAIMIALRHHYVTCCVPDGICKIRSRTAEPKYDSIPGTTPFDHLDRDVDSLRVYNI